LKLSIEFLTKGSVVPELEGSSHLVSRQYVRSALGAIIIPRITTGMLAQGKQFNSRSISERLPWLCHIYLTGTRYAPEIEVTSVTGLSWRSPCPKRRAAMHASWRPRNQQMWQVKTAMVIHL
jgi:hypothetical protein